MSPLVDKIVSVLETQLSGPAVDEAILDAAFLFEKARGWPPAGASDAVMQSDVSAEDVVCLKSRLVAFIERGGRGSWALGKTCDPALRPVYAGVLRREIDGDAGELFQAIMALQNIGECFDESGSYSLLDESRNRALARRYLDSICSANGRFPERWNR